MSKTQWWRFNLTNRTQGNNVIPIGEQRTAQKLKRINDASEKFSPFFQPFYHTWGYDTTLKVLATYAAWMISKSAAWSSDVDKFVHILRYRVKVFRDRANEDETK